jgi:hypothetical protein
LKYYKAKAKDGVLCSRFLNFDLKTFYNINFFG